MQSVKNKLIIAGRAAYALGMAGLGVQQFIYPGFRPVFVPGWPDAWPDERPLVYLFSLALIAYGVSIIFNFRARHASLICGGVLLVMFALVHVPYRLTNNPGMLAAWTNAFKILALSGSAFVVANSFPRTAGKSTTIIQVLETLIPLGRIFLGVMLFIFGIDHFLYAEGVATLVPAWIPGHLFWTYFAGVALIGAGVSMIINFRLQMVAVLTGIMIFFWFLILHIPRAVAMPDLLNGNEITSVMQSLAFSGVAFVLAFTGKGKSVSKLELRQVALEE